MRRCLVEPAPDDRMRVSMPATTPVEAAHGRAVDKDLFTHWQTNTPSRNVRVSHSRFATSCRECKPRKRALGMEKCR